MSSSRLTIFAGAMTAFLLSVVLGMQFNPQAWHGDLLDPDSSMRLVRLEDILQAHAPLSTVARDGSGAGTLLHWSHLLDSVLLIAAAPTAAFIGWHRALVPVALLFGPLGMAALGGALAWAAQPFADRQWCWISAALACLSVPIIGYGLPGVVHHHVLLAVVAIMTGGWAVRVVRGVGHGMALGSWAAVGVWLSPESMPLSLMALCLVWLAWLSRPSPQVARALAESGLALFVVTTAAWLVDPPAAGLWVAEQDRLSIIFVTLAAAAALCGVSAFAALPRWWVVVLGGALAAAWLTAFPMVLNGTHGLLPPDVAHDFLDGITEMQPVTTVGEALSYLVPAAAAGGALFVLGVRRRSALLLYSAVCAALLVLAAAQHVRFATYAAVLAVALTPVALTMLGRTRLRTGVLAMALVLPLLNNVIAASEASPARKSCGMAGVAALLAPFAGEVVLADVNETPDLLRRSAVLTVGSLYHRNPAGFMRLRAAWRSVPGRATPPPAVVATGARLVLVCPGAKLPGFLADAPSPSLASSLQAGDVPLWLHEVGRVPEDGFVLYAVDPRGKP